MTGISWEMRRWAKAFFAAAFSDDQSACPSEKKEWVWIDLRPFFGAASQPLSFVVLFQIFWRIFSRVVGLLLPASDILLTCWHLQPAHLHTWHHSRKEYIWISYFIHGHQSAWLLTYSKYIPKAANSPSSAYFSLSPPDRQSILNIAKSVKNVVNANSEYVRMYVLYVYSILSSWSWYNNVKKWISPSLFSKVCPQCFLVNSPWVFDILKNGAKKWVYSSLLYKSVLSMIPAWSCGWPNGRPPLW